MKAATTRDLPRLLVLMAEFYAEAGYALHGERATTGFSASLADAGLGGAWLIESDSIDAGYVVLTTCFSMEYGGLVGFLDDFYVRPSFRGRGLGTRTLEELREQCIALNLRALFVEVAPDNAAAQRTYRRAGFAETNRQLLALPLAPPSHQTT